MGEKWERGLTHLLRSQKGRNRRSSRRLPRIDEAGIGAKEGGDGGGGCQEGAVVKNRSDETGETLVRAGEARQTLLCDVRKADVLLAVSVKMFCDATRVSLKEWEGREKGWAHLQ